MSARAEVALLRGVSKAYRAGPRQVTLFEDFSLSLAPGTRLAVMGPNACGKSTLTRLLLGIESPDRGEVGAFMGERDLLGAVLQDYRGQLLPWASVRTNLELPLGGGRAAGLEAAELVRDAEALLAAFGYDIPLDQAVQRLSGGQQQAVVLARALAFRPSFFVWDEPTSAIDIVKRVALRRRVSARWRELGAGAVIVTHDLDEVLALADRVVVFDVGMRLLCDLPVQGGEGHPRPPDFLESDGARRTVHELRAAMSGGGP